MLRKDLGDTVAFTYFKSSNERGNNSLAFDDMFYAIGVNCLYLFDLVWLRGEDLNL